MKILVIGGTHGNEQLGVSIVSLLRCQPIENVDCLIANPKAVAMDARFVETDLNRSFGISGVSYEISRANEIEMLVKPYDIVLDFHNTMTAENDCCFIGESSQNVLRTVAQVLQLKNCIIATYDCINKQCPNVLSIEISLGGQLDSAKLWYERIKCLVTSEYGLGNDEVQLYRLVGRVTWEESDKLDVTKWRPFRQISRTDQTKLGYIEPVYPIFIGSKLTEYFGSLLIKEAE